MKNESWLMNLYGLSPKDLARNLDFNLGNALISILSCDSNIFMNQKFTAKKDLIMAIEFLKDELSKLDDKTLDKIDDSYLEKDKDCDCKCSNSYNCMCSCKKENKDTITITNIGDCIENCTYIPIDEIKKQKMHLKCWWIEPDLRDTILFCNSIANENFSYDITLIYTSKGADGLPKKNYKLLFSEIESPTGPRLNTKFIIELPFSSDEVNEDDLINTIKSYCIKELNENIECMNDLKKVLLKPDSLFKFNNKLTLKYDLLKEANI